MERKAEKAGSRESGYKKDFHANETRALRR